MKISFISLPLTGHLNPMRALARRLQTRGHQIVFHGCADMKQAVMAGGLAFSPVGQDSQPLGWLPDRLFQLSSRSGMDALQGFVDTVSAPLLESVLRELPARFTEEGIEAVVIDAGFVLVELAPMSMNLPFAQVWAITHHHPAGLMPLPYFSDAYEDSPEARERYLKGAEQVAGYGATLAGPASTFIQKTGLKIDLSNPGQTTSNLAIVSQMPHEFDFPLPLAAWPSTFHFTAPFVDAEMRAEVPFPWERLTGEPVIYASLGTLVGNQPSLLTAIVRGAASLPGTQLVLATGPFVKPETVEGLPSNAVVVQEAPQLKLLGKAALCVSHAGLNTVLEALTAGVPQIVVPVAYDQFGVAARIKFHGVGLFTELNEATPERMALLMRNVLEDPSYRTRAQTMGSSVAAMDGPGLAAEILERAFTSEQTPAVG